MSATAFVAVVVLIAAVIWVSSLQRGGTTEVDEGYIPTAFWTMDDTVLWCLLRRPLPVAVAEATASLLAWMHPGPGALWMLVLGPPAPP